MFPHLLDESSKISSSSHHHAPERNIHTAAVSSKPFRPDGVAAAPFRGALAASLLGARPTPGSLLAVGNAFEVPASGPVRHDITDSEADSEAEEVKPFGGPSSSTSSTSATAASASKNQLPLRPRGAQWTDPSTPVAANKTPAAQNYQSSSSSSTIVVSDSDSDDDVPQVEFVNPLAKWLPTVKNPSVAGSPMNKAPMKSGSAAASLSSSTSGLGATAKPGGLGMGQGMKKPLQPARIDISESEDEVASTPNALPSALQLRVQSMTSTFDPRALGTAATSPLSSSSTQPKPFVANRPGVKRTSPIPISSSNFVRLVSYI